MHLFVMHRNLKRSTLLKLAGALSGIKKKVVAQHTQKHTCVQEMTKKSVST